MTINTHITQPEYMRALLDDGSGGLVDAATQQARTESDFAQMGFVYTDYGDISTTASVRVAGQFTSAWDAMAYLEIGGLTATDGSGNLAPIGFVYFLKEFDEGLGEYTYTVYIDEET